MISTAAQRLANEAVSMTRGAYLVLGAREPCSRQDRALEIPNRLNATLMTRWTWPPTVGPPSLVPDILELLGKVRARR